MSVHNVSLLSYARQKNAHLPHLNSAFLTSQVYHVKKSEAFLTVALHLNIMIQILDFIDGL